MLNPSLIAAIIILWLLILLPLGAGYFLKKEKYLNVVNELNDYLKNWFVILGFFSFIYMSSVGVACIAMIVASFVTLKEYFSKENKYHYDRTIMGLLIGITLLQYIFVYSNFYGMVSIFIPFIAFTFLQILILLRNNHYEFPAKAININWGMLICIYMLSNALYYLELPKGFMDANGGKAWLFVVISLILVSDVSEYFCEKYFGKTAVKFIKPYKTFEGFIGGMLLTILAAEILAQFLTSLSIMSTVATGMMIFCAVYITKIATEILRQILGINYRNEMMFMTKLELFTFVIPIMLHVGIYFY